MIRPLRQRHRRIVIMLGVFLPIAFAVGIAARKQAPGMAVLPSVLTDAPQTFDVTEWERADLFVKTRMQVRLLRASAAAGQFAVEFSPPRDFLKPDLIVYWVAGSPNLTDKLPDNALLLGGFDSSVVLPLPPGAASGGGVLVLYSLADNELVDVSRHFQLNGFTK